MSVKNETASTQPAADKIIKRFRGVVVGVKNDKTVLVRVESVKLNKKYKKRYTVSRNYQVHDEKNVCQEGEQVSFIECRPFSKTKRWRLTSN
jgi:small subunit ribosomal protein S17